MIAYAKEQGVQMTFHYVPLHSAPAGEKYGRFNGLDEYTTSESDKLARLPMYYGLKQTDLEKVITTVKAFFC